jgi:hypothetical protein
MEPKKKTKFSSVGPPLSYWQYESGAMNQLLTELAFVLDRSGSMGCVAESAVAGFNAFLRDQQTAPGHARFTLVLFDDQYLVPAEALPISQVAPLDATTYVPRGSTALLDAMGRTIDDLGRRLAGVPEPERPAKVIVAILTDGYENASQQYTQRDVAARIRRQRDQYGWKFLFLGANQDAIATAAQLNIASHDAATFQADAAGARASFKSTSRKASSFRMAALTPCAPPPADASMPLSEMLAEEDQAERGKP